MVKGTSYREGPETDRLILRAFCESDAAAFFALNSHPEVMRYTGEAPLTSLDEAKRAITSYPDFETVGFGRWACVVKATGEIAGFCGLKYLLDLDEVDIGYRLLPKYWGQGIATEASQASLRFGFETLGLERIIGLVLPSNSASIRVLQKCEMKFEREAILDDFLVHRYVKVRVQE